MYIYLIQFIDPFGIHKCLIKRIIYGSRKSFNYYVQAPVIYNSNIKDIMGSTYKFVYKWIPNNLRVGQISLSKNVCYDYYFCLLNNN